ncbi:MAG: hypothetical protein ACTSXL_00765 [Alphaproteobacteria bacterium]
MKNIQILFYVILCFFYVNNLCAQNNYYFIERKNTLADRISSSQRAGVPSSKAMREFADSQMRYTTIINPCILAGQTIIQALQNSNSPRAGIFLERIRLVKTGCHNNPHRANIEQDTLFVQASNLLQPEIKKSKKKKERVLKKVDTLIQKMENVANRKNYVK